MAIEPITEAEIAALFSADSKLLTRAIVTVANDLLSTKSTSGGSQRVTLSGGVAVAAAQACRFCRLQVAAANTEVVRVRIGDAVIDATTGIELPGNPVLTPYSISNLNLLYFYSADVDAIVDIEYFD